MAICIKLDKEISCEYICHRIQEMLNKHNQNNTTNQETVLTIDIKEIIDAVETTPKLEYKNIEVDN
jgi:hypothetical protein